LILTEGTGGLKIEGFDYSKDHYFFHGTGRGGMRVEELGELIRGRRSIRRWKDREVSEDLLVRAVEMATWAPNGGNFQGWRFIAVTNRELIVRMADAVQAAADKIASWPEARAWQEDMERYRKNTSYFRNAPACIAVFIGRYESAADKILSSREESDPEAKQIRGFRRSAPTGLQSAAAAITTLLLVFHAMGLGAVWLGAPLIAKREIEELLSAPAGLDLVSLVAVGHPDEHPHRDRRPVSEVLEFIR
jgi:nitroreductase